MPYAFITEIKNLRKHNNADRLQVGECFGNSVIVSLETQEGELGVYFPTDTQLGEKYATENELIRVKDEAGNNIGGYLDADKRNIKAIKLRGEMSDGLFMPLTSLENFTKIANLKQGDCVDTLNGEMIAQKYIPRGNRRGEGAGTAARKAKVKDYDFPIFSEHTDTAQYAYNKHVFKEGDILNISLKMHGTSGRTSNTLVRKYTAPTAINKILMRLRLKKAFEESYKLVSGTRRVVLKSFEGGYYGTNDFRKRHHDQFEGKLIKGETAYYEIVGYEDTGATIMSTCDNGKTQDKEFIKKYGKTTAFTYDCAPGTSDIYVYRMTMTTESGDVFEYPTWLVAQRCAEMGMKVVPTLATVVFTTIEELNKIVDELSDGVDPIGLTHIREGCVIRIENRSKITVYKHKNFFFKVLEGIIKDAGIAEKEELEEIEFMAE